MAETELDGVTADDELEDAPRKSRLRLENSATIKRHLVAIFDDVRRGRISSLEGNRRARLLREISRANEELGLERRLARLEAAEEARRAGRGRGR